MLRRLKLVHIPATLVGGRLLRALSALGVVAVGLGGSMPPAAAATPVTITTMAEAGLSDVFATATLAGGHDPTGVVTFRLFGPGDDSCARAPLFTSTNPVTGAGDPKHATSGHVVLPGPGVYHFVAVYGGDSGNAPAGPTPCGDPGAAVGIGGSSFAFSARASAPAIVGGAVSDTATIASSSPLSGTMRFALFGPGTTSCTAPPVFTSARQVRGAGSYTSDAFVPASPGSYHWVAAYTDNAGGPSAQTSCDDPAQRVEVSAAPGGARDRCVLPAATRAVLERQVAAYRQVLAALLSRAGGQVERALAACRAALPAD